MTTNSCKLSELDKECFEKLDIYGIVLDGEYYDMDSYNKKDKELFPDFVKKNQIPKTKRITIVDCHN